MCSIGVGRFRILGWPRFRILGGPRGPNSQQVHDVVTTSMRRNEVASTSFRRHVPTRFLINQCQIIAFLILKSYIIQNARIELRGIVLPVPSNKLKLHLFIIFSSAWYICDFFLFHIEIEGKCGWIIGGAKGMLPPPSNYWGAWPSLPPPPSPAYAYVFIHLPLLHLAITQFRDHVIYSS